MERRPIKEKETQTDFEKGLIAAIHDYVVNYQGEIGSISKNTIDKITMDLLSDFKFEITYARKNSRGIVFPEKTIYCDGNKAVAFIEEAEEKGTAINIHPNPYIPKLSNQIIGNECFMNGYRRQVQTRDHSD